MLLGNAQGAGRNLAPVGEMEYLALNAPKVRHRLWLPFCAGKTWTSGNCNDCEGWRVALWVRGSVVQVETLESIRAFAVSIPGFLP